MLAEPWPYKLLPYRVPPNPAPSRAGEARAAPFKLRRAMPRRATPATCPKSPFICLAPLACSPHAPSAGARQRSKTTTVGAELQPAKCRRLGRERHVLQAASITSPNKLPYYAFLCSAMHQRIRLSSHCQRRRSRCRQRHTATAACGA
jgi:hypothetical protein